MSSSRPQKKKQLIEHAAFKPLHYHVGLARRIRPQLFDNSIKKNLTRLTSCSYFWQFADQNDQYFLQKFNRAIHLLWFLPKTIFLHKKSKLSIVINGTVSKSSIDHIYALLIYKIFIFL